MERHYCWKCDRVVPLLDEAEWAPIQRAMDRMARMPNRTEEENRALRSVQQQATDAHRKITGWYDAGMWHHRRGAFGEPCAVCHRLRRTPKATRCVACGAPDKSKRVRPHWSELAAHDERLAVPYAQAAALVAHAELARGGNVSHILILVSANGAVLNSWSLESTGLLDRLSALRQESWPSPSAFVYFYDQQADEGLRLLSIHVEFVPGEVEHRFLQEYRVLDSAPVMLTGPLFAHTDPAFMTPL